MADDEPVDRFDAGIDGSLDKATVAWAAQADAHGSAGPPDVRALAARLLDTEHHALSPADACPDNNLLTDRRLRLIDFEWSEVRHPAWDAAYLAVPWPTCWCSWRIPGRVRRPGARRLPRDGGPEAFRTSPPMPSRPTWPPHGPAGRWSRCRGP